jgi:hypothetical protein
MENVMSKEAANADLAAAAFWKSVAASDRMETAVAVTKVREYTADARREAKEPSEGTRRTQSRGAG